MVNSLVGLCVLVVLAVIGWNLMWWFAEAPQRFNGTVRVYGSTKPFMDNMTIKQADIVGYIRRRMSITGNFKHDPVLHALFKLANQSPESRQALQALQMVGWAASVTGEHIYQYFGQLVRDGLVMRCLNSHGEDTVYLTPLGRNVVGSLHLLDTAILSKTRIDIGAYCTEKATHISVRMGLHLANQFANCGMACAEDGVSHSRERVAA